jgi:hypothetical protein
MRVRCTNPRTACAAAGIRGQLRKAANAAGVPRRFAPHSSGTLALSRCPARSELPLAPLLIDPSSTREDCSGSRRRWRFRQLLQTAE